MVTTCLPRLSLCFPLEHSGHIGDSAANIGESGANIGDSADIFQVLPETSLVEWDFSRKKGRMQGMFFPSTNCEGFLIF